MSQLDRTWVVSDTHFGHTNVIKYDTRPFKDVQHMNEVLVANWNSVVRPGDVVWHLGDVARNLEEAARIVPRLNGNIMLVRGNHDDPVWKARIRLPLFAEYHEAKYVRLDGERFYFSHYACRVWRNSHHGSFMVHGHSHGALPRWGRSLDAGVNCNGYKPLSLQQVIETLRDESPVDHHALPNENN